MRKQVERGFLRHTGRTTLGYPGALTFGVAGGPNFTVGQRFTIAQIQRQAPHVVDVDKFVRQNFFHFGATGTLTCIVVAIGTNDHTHGCGSHDKGPGTGFGARIGTCPTGNLHPFVGFRR